MTSCSFNRDWKNRKEGETLAKLRMSKVDRIFFITENLISNPGKVISLKYFVENLGAAKSTISEDITEIKHNLQIAGKGTLVTVSGKNGGIKFIPIQSKEKIADTLEELKYNLTQIQRILPGGYLYMGDLISDPLLMDKAAKILAGYFYTQTPEVVLTVETKGILLAGYTAGYLGIPLAIARRNSRVTEGSVLTINYVSGSGNQIQTMSLSTRSLSRNTRVLIIDDFMKRGGTVTGMNNLAKEFGSQVVGVGVLLEQGVIEEKLIQDHISLGILDEIDENKGEINLTMQSEEIFSDYSQQKQEKPFLM